MVRLLSLLIWAAAAIAVPLVGVETRSGPDPSTLHIQQIIFNGDGCPSAASTTVILDPDGQSFTVTFTQMAAQVGPGVSLLESQRYCILSFILHIAPGLQYAIDQFIVSGFKNLQKGVTGYQENTYSFSGSTTKLIGRTNFTGPTFGDYTATNTFGIVSYSTCGGNATLNLNTQVALKQTKANAAGVLKETQEEGTVTLKARLCFRQCKNY